jgi:hypothetical protein
MCPHRFGNTWSSMFSPATPMAIRRSTFAAALTAFPPPVSSRLLKKSPEGIDRSIPMYYDAHGL